MTNDQITEFLVHRLMVEVVDTVQLPVLMPQHTANTVEMDLLQIPHMNNVMITIQLTMMDVVQHVRRKP